MKSKKLIFHLYIFIYLLLLIETSSDTVYFTNICFDDFNKNPVKNLRAIRSFRILGNYLMINKLIVLIEIRANSSIFSEEFVNLTSILRHYSAEFYTYNFNPIENEWNQIIK